MRTPRLHLSTSRIILGMVSVLAVFAASAAAATLYMSMTRADAKQAPAGHGTDITTSSTATSGFSVESVSASAFDTTIHLNVQLADPLGDGYSPALDNADLHMVTDKGDRLDPSSWIRAVDYGITADRRTAQVTIEGNPLPADTTSLNITLDALYTIPPNGSGVRPAGPWRGVATVDLARTPSSTNITAKLPTRIVDTGHGWRYVVDSLETDSSTLRLTYHVEGDTLGLSTLPIPNIVAGTLAATFPSGGEHETVETDRVPGTSSVTIKFGAAARTVTSPGSVVISRIGDTWAPSRLSLGGGAWEVNAASIQDHSEPFFSVSIASTLMLNLPGTHEGQPTLTDNLGRSYPLYHGSANFPPTTTTFDFDGTVDPAATQLTLAVPGYSSVESGDWTLSAPIS